jgi:ubiquinone/menaquinone biosynthesis C-methylase UbiE
MFNNLVNVQDVFDLVRLGPRKAFARIVARLTKADKDIVSEKWSYDGDETSYWWDIPAVCARCNDLVSGNPTVDHYEYISGKYLYDRHSLRGLSLGCGDGHRELRWAMLNKFDHIDAFDLSESQLQKAAQLATRKGYGNTITYTVGDVFKIGMLENYYDIVIGEHSVHHFSPLDVILRKVSRVLKSDGFFVINEFIGPTRFQWTDRQLEATNGLLSVLPAKYRKLVGSGFKANEIKNSRLRMILRDPSEAIESARILPLLREIFEVVEIKGYGGPLLHLLFDGIARNFLSEDAETRRWLETCFQVEDLLLASGELQSDFVVAVCRKKGS